MNRPEDASDDPARAVESAEQMIAAGDIGNGLRTLQDATYNISSTTPAREALFGRVYRAAEVASQAENGRYAQRAKNLAKLVDSREEAIGITLAQQSRDPAAAAAGARPVVSLRNDPYPPWFYGAASLVAAIAIIASILSVIGGVVIGIELSRYTGTDVFGVPETHHHASVIGYWIGIGVSTGAVWLALAVGLNLLADVGRSLRAIAARNVERSPD